MAGIFERLDKSNEEYESKPHFVECRWCGCRYGEHRMSELPFCSKKCETEALAFFGKQKEANKNQSKSGKECKVCGTEPVEEKAQFCSNCGSPLSKRGWNCSCDGDISRVIMGDYCPICGRRDSSDKI
jgi:ribosomal protein L37E